MGNMLDGGAGEVDQIGRHERQHAGRQEADQAGDQRGGNGDIVHHTLSMHRDRGGMQAKRGPSEHFVIYL